MPVILTIYVHLYIHNRYVDQGGGKRKGSFAIYLEPWHADVFDFLDLKKNHGKEEARARDLFYALWIPDLFMRRVEENGNWTLFCPNEAPGLADAVGKIAIVSIMFKLMFILLTPYHIIIKVISL